MGWCASSPGPRDAGTTGPVVRQTISPIFFDVSLAPNTAWSQSIPASHAAFIHAIEGSVLVGEAGDGVPEGAVGVLGPEGRAQLVAGEGGSRFLFAAGRRLDEPVARYGPFVMNTEQELVQAFNDYRAGRF